MEFTLFLLLLLFSLHELAVGQECVDLTSDCSQMANLCVDPNFKDIMSKRCPKTCGLCGCEDDSCVCEDLIELCASADYQSFLQKHCPKTCGFCTLECADADSTCGQEAALCEDEELAEIMVRRCPLTCGTCSWNGNWVLNDGNGAYYTVITKESSWEVLENMCKAIGGHLTSIESTAENNFVVNMIGDNSAWIGIRSQGGRQRWSDGSTTDYTNWRFDGSHTRCGMLLDSDYEGTWEDTPCELGNFGVCKKAAKP